MATVSAMAAVLGPEVPARDAQPGEDSGEADRDDDGAADDGAQHDPATAQRQRGGNAERQPGDDHRERSGSEADAAGCHRPAAATTSTTGGPVAGVRQVSGRGGQQLGDRRRSGARGQHRRPVLARPRSRRPRLALLQRRPCRGLVGDDGDLEGFGPGRPGRVRPVICSTAGGGPATASRTPFGPEFTAMPTNRARISESPAVSASDQRDRLSRLACAAVRRRRPTVDGRGRRRRRTPVRGRRLRLGAARAVGGVGAVPAPELLQIERVMASSFPRRIVRFIEDAPLRAVRQERIFGLLMCRCPRSPTPTASHAANRS